MTKRIVILFAAVMFLAMTAAAQESKPSDNSKSATSATTKKLVSIAGRIADDGKTFVADGNGVVWKILNPSMLEGDLGTHVVINAVVDAMNHAIEITAVRINTAAAARLRDAAFRR
jgi:hypothetical protein